MLFSTTLFAVPSFEQSVSFFHIFSACFASVPRFVSLHFFLKFAFSFRLFYGRCIACLRTFGMSGLRQGFLELFGEEGDVLVVRCLIFFVAGLFLECLVCF